MENTIRQYSKAMKSCNDVFIKKMKDYGIAWRILRTSSLTDQIYIKANRIRSIEEKGKHEINEGVLDEFIGIVNYSIMALVQLELGPADTGDEDRERAFSMYNKYAKLSMELMEKKNHDYDEAWRNMRISSLTDIILMKLMRIKQIENNQGRTEVSEGLDANYFDIINYAVFALIKLDEPERSKQL